jgi:integrase
MKSQDFPISIKRGVVKIYRTPQRIGGTEYEAFTISYLSDGKRQRKKFSDLEEATKEGKAIAAKIYGGEHDLLQMSSADRTNYLLATETLKPAGTPLPLAASEYAKAWEILGGGSLVEAARYYAKKHPTKMPRKTVPEVVAEFIDAKRKAGKSDEYIGDLTYRCGKFASAFSVQILDVTAKDLREWLESLKLSGRSQNNFRRTVGTLFEFAKSRGYLPKDHDELDGVDIVEQGEGEITIFTPQELREIISRADHRFIPFLVIGAFAGLRTAEIERLDWREVNLAEGFIEVKAKNAKTKARRLVPILPNLSKWLAPYAAPFGRVVPFTDFGFQIQELCAERKEGGKVTRPSFKWKINALRHSFISYRVADIKDVPQVALEAGNSPQMIFSNYRQLVGESAAKTWFSIAPETSEKIVPMRIAGS